MKQKNQAKEIRSAYRKEKKRLKREYKANRKTLGEKYNSDITAYYNSIGGKPKSNPPRRGVLEEIGNATTHGVGSLFAALALVLMCLSADATVEYVGASIYSAGMFVMFTMSCLYHALPFGGRVKRIFRRFDYSCIYLLIGATFAPILLCYIGGTLGLVFFIIQWVVIITGITMVAVFGPTKLRFLHIPLYMVLGWCGIFFLPEMVTRGDYLFLSCILGGGVIYSLGMIPFALKKKVAHFIWHFFVLAGAVVQWVGVYLTVYLK